VLDLRPYVRCGEPASVNERGAPGGRPWSRTENRVDYVALMVLIVFSE
jgi:hypothetical protein